MKAWQWLTMSDPTPGLTRTKMIRLAVRVLLFSLAATLISSLLQLTPVGPYLNTWWGSLLFILALYIPVARYMMLDFGARRPAGGRGVQNSTRTTASRTERRKERNRYAGVKKSAPKYGGRR